jgi:hypothetical protein
MKVLAVGFDKRAEKYAQPRGSEGIAKMYLRKAEDFLESNKGEQLPPCFILFSEEEVLAIDGRSLMDGGQGKDVFAALAKNMAKEMGAIASVFFSEMWFAKATPDDQEMVRQGKEPTRPSLNPDRIEGIIVVGEYSGVKPYVSASCIVRDSAGLVMSLKPLLMPAGARFEGRFTGII